MNRIQRSANTFIKENHITLNNINSEKFLTEIVLKQGYRVYKFADFESDELIKRLNIGKQYTDSFTYTGNGFKCIFIKQLYSEKRISALLLHELAHIWLGHMNNEILADSDECEADMFVSCIWEEISEKSKKTVLKYAAIPSFVIVIIYSFVLYACNTAKNAQSDTSEAISAAVIVTETQQEEQQNVYVTRSGKKYHKAGCRHIKNRETIEISISEAENSGYTPCLDCF